MTDNIPSVVIREVGAQRRELRLTQRALPQGQLSFEVKQRMEITYYQGNPVATSTLLGTEEGGTSIGGTWKFKFIGRGGMAFLNNVEIKDIDALVDLCESMTRAGTLIEVTWGRRRRYGHIESFKHDWINTCDVAWSMSFKWTSNAAPVSVPIVNDTDASNTARRMRRRAEDIETASTPDFDADPDFLDRINDLFADVQTAVTGIEDSVNAQFSTITSAGDAISRSSSAITSVASRAYAAAVEIAETPIGDMFNVKSFDDLYDISKSTLLSPITPILGFGEYLVAESWRRGLVSQYNQLGREGASTVDAINVVDEEILGVYTARAGDDLRDVSFAYYGSNDQWRDLMVYNQLQTAELAPGQIIYVPRRAQEVRQ
jgi:hypothetical protein